MKYCVGAMWPEMCELLDNIVLVGATVAANHEVVAADVIWEGGRASLGLGPDLGPNLFCRSVWGNNDGGSSEYWPRDLSKGPGGCMGGGDHDGGGGSWCLPMGSVCLSRGLTDHGGCVWLAGMELPGWQLVHGQWVQGYEGVWPGYVEYSCVPRTGVKIMVAVEMPQTSSEMNLPRIPRKGKPRAKG